MSSSESLSEGSPCLLGPSWRVSVVSFGLNSTEMARLVDMDRLRINFGPALEELTGRTQDVEKLERLWAQLKPQQQEMVVELMSAMTRKNRGSRKSQS